MFGIQIIHFGVSWYSLGSFKDKLTNLAAMAWESVVTRGLDSQLLEFWVSSLECLVDGEGNKKLEEKKDIFDIIQRLKSSETALLTFR